MEICIYLLCLFVSIYSVYARPSSSTSLTLRFRALNGSIVRVDGCKGEEMLKDILARNEITSDGMILESGDIGRVDAVKSLNELDLKNGSLITIKSSSTVTTGGGLQKRKTKSNALSSHSSTWQPFPGLAKPDYANIVRRAKARANIKSSMSYSDLNDITSALHVIEAQKEGNLKRIYLCADSAQKFQANSIKHSSLNPKVALLFGTFHKERETERKARTSLSSTTDSTKLCEVAKVQALYVLPNTQTMANPEVKRAISLAKKLNLCVIGCIYSYDAESRTDQDDVVHGSDIIMMAKLQIENMRASKSSKFIFLAMETREGTTEGFQLSDSSVQMIYEGILTDEGVENPKKLKANIPVLLEGKEVEEIDCLLCLVNTGLLSHTGNFRSRSGSLSKKVKRRLRKKLDENEIEFVDHLCDFSLLLAMDKLLDKNQMDGVCDLVTKRTQKKKVMVNKALRLVLETILDD